MSILTMLNGAYGILAFYIAYTFIISSVLILEEFQNELLFLYSRKTRV